MLYPKVLEKPSAKTVHGLIPALAEIIIDSPNPNNPNPKQSMNDVKGLGANLKVFLNSSLSLEQI